MKATKEQIRQWLDMQIGAKAIQCQELVLTEKIKYVDIDEGKIVPDVTLINLSRCGHVHLNSEAFRLIADVLEFPIAVIDKGEDVQDYRYELQFYYNGVKFLAIETESDYKERGELA